MSLDPKNYAAVERVLGRDSARGAEVSPMAAELNTLLHAVRQEGRREALGDGPATVLDQLAMAALPHALSRARADAERYGDKLSPEDHAPKATREAYRIARLMMKERSNGA